MEEKQEAAVEQQTPAINPFEQRKRELRSIFASYFPENKLYFAGDEDIPDTEGVRSVLERNRGSAVVAYDGNFFMMHPSNDLDVFTLNFFYGIASTIGARFIRNAIIGPEADMLIPEGFPSSLSTKAFTWYLAFCYAAKHGYVYANPNGVNGIIYAYADTFAAVLSEDDDGLRNRLSRDAIYQDLVGWDFRAEKGIQAMEEHYAEEKDDNALHLVQQIKANLKAYPFQGQDKLGTFISGFGYFSPNQKLPIYRTIVPPDMKGEDKRTIDRANLDAHIFIEAVHYMNYLYDHGIEDPDMTRFRFCSVNKDAGTFIISDAINDATDEEARAEYSILRASMDLPIPKILDLVIDPLSFVAPTDDEAKEEVDDNGDH